MKLRKLCISCGGTGGHFYPGLAVAREFKKQGGEVLLLLGGKHTAKQSEAAKACGISSAIIAAQPLSIRPAGFLKFTAAALKGMVQCLKIYSKFKQDALLAMGSFASFPPILAAKAGHVPLFLHDGNARLGKTNLKLGPWAKGFALSFPTNDSAKCGCPAVLTGMPLRPELIEQRLPKEKAVEEINKRWNVHFDANRPTVLVFGGSLGAASINNNCRVPLTQTADSVQLIHLTGADKFAEVEAYYKDAPFPHLLLDSSPEMHLFYSAADWIVCRAGGSTVSEIACFAKYALLIPYPFAAQDHQTDNAHYLTPSGGAEMLPDKDLTAEVFQKKLSDFLANPEEYREKGKRNEVLAFPDASDRVIKMIDSFLTVPE